MNEYTKLLKEWCDRLIDLQIKDVKEPTAYGAIVCPACGVLHGRIADAVYPMVVMYHKSGEQKYMDCAKRVVDWSEYNLLTDDGGYHNDKVNLWCGITVFSGVALGNTLMRHKECIDDETYSKWYRIFVRMSEFVYEYFGSKDFYSNINYLSTQSCLMAMAYKLTGNEKYKARMISAVEYSKRHFNSDNLLIGEGDKHEFVSKKGCNYIDIGYNVEETLPALIECAHIMGNEKDMKYFAEKFMAHIEFMMPDGGWDNTMGSRAYKWTYWGSRTSDGCQVGLSYLAEYDAVFAEAAQRNFELYKRCTKDGLLYGGRMYIQSGEEPCVHHTFCHAKALAVMVDTGFEYKCRVQLPRDGEYGIKHFSTIGARLVSVGDWRATVSDNDAIGVYKYGTDVSGGTLSMLWHNRAEVIFASCAREYNKALEPTNMQYNRNRCSSGCCTLRIDKGEYTSQQDINSQVHHTECGGRVEVTAKGTLRDRDYNGYSKYFAAYVFEKDSVAIKLCCEPGCTVTIPVVAAKGELEAASDRHFVVSRNGVQVHITTDKPAKVNPDEFSLTGGFEFVPLTLTGYEEVNVTIMVDGEFC